MACSSWYVLANVPQYSLRTNHAVRTTNLPAPNCTHQNFSNTLSILSNDQ